jgi:hypothetical protein
MLENSANMFIHYRQTLYGYTKFAVVERADPRWRFGDVLKDFVGVEHDSNGFLWGIAQSTFELCKGLLQTC